MFTPCTTFSLNLCLQIYHIPFIPSEVPAISTAYEPHPKQFREIDRNQSHKGSWADQGWSTWCSVGYPYLSSSNEKVQRQWTRHSGARVLEVVWIEGMMKFSEVEKNLRQATHRPPPKVCFIVGRGMSQCIEGTNIKILQSLGADLARRHE